MPEEGDASKSQLEQAEGTSRIDVEAAEAGSNGGDSDAMMMLDGLESQENEDTGTELHAAEGSDAGEQGDRGEHAEELLPQASHSTDEAVMEEADVGLESSDNGLMLDGADSSGEAASGTGVGGGGVSSTEVGPGQQCVLEPAQCSAKHHDADSGISRPGIVGAGDEWEFEGGQEPDVKRHNADASLGSCEDVLKYGREKQPSEAESPAAEEAGQDGNFPQLDETAQAEGFPLDQEAPQVGHGSLILDAGAEGQPVQSNDAGNNIEAKLVSMSIANASSAVKLSDGGLPADGQGEKTSRASCGYADCSNSGVSGSGSASGCSVAVRWEGDAVSEEVHSEDPYLSGHEVSGGDGDPVLTEEPQDQAEAVSVALSIGESSASAKVSQTNAVDELEGSLSSAGGAAQGATQGTDNMSTARAAPAPVASPQGTDAAASEEWTGGDNDSGDSMPSEDPSLSISSSSQKSQDKVRAHTASSDNTREANPIIITVRPDSDHGLRGDVGPDALMSPDGAYSDAFESDVEAESEEDEEAVQQTNPRDNASHHKEAAPDHKERRDSVLGMAADLLKLDDASLFDDMSDEEARGSSHSGNNVSGGAGDRRNSSSQDELLELSSSSASNV
ncbi:unnamed protein product [Chrysoparadoxa australica]